MDFNLPYKRSNYIKFFRGPWFLPEDFEEASEPIQLTFSPQYTQQVTKIGQASSLDLNVYEVQHTSENDPRVSLSKESFRLLAEYGQKRALILFVSKASPNYRLSLVTIDLKWEEGKRPTREYSNPRRYSFFLGPDAKVHTPQQYLISPGRAKDFEDMQNRFSIEVVNKEFYTKIALLFTKLTGGKRKLGSRTFDEGKGILVLPGTTDETRKKEFAVRMIGRLVFCWFLKKKVSAKGISLIPEGLLSADAVKNNSGYYHNILEPLFFEVLNTPIKERNKKFQGNPWLQIPFLNGGLFMPHEHDFYEPAFTGFSKHLNTLKVPDDWLAGLFEIFETYNFTIDENTSMDVELSIEPEILGRIFENLLAEINPETGKTARKATGSYYTPRPIVEYMVDESLKQYLLTKTQLTEEKISSLLSYAEEEPGLSESQKDAVLDALDSIKIIDPACGSGAFPMGILQKILLVLQKVDPDSRKWLSKILAKIGNSTVRKVFEKKLKYENWNYVHKLGIIQSSIYGVDIQPIAVEISKLRCFLSLIVDQSVDDSKPNRGVESLPNLDFRFVCGNSLTNTIFSLPVQLGVLAHRDEAKKLINNIEQNKSMYFSLSTEKDKVQMQLELLRQKLELAEYFIRDKVDEFTHTRAYTKSFLDDTLSKKDAKAKAANEAIKKDLEFLRKQVSGVHSTLQTKKIKTYQDIDKIKDEYFSKFFVWRMDFAEVFSEKDGFDVVIANPPYITVALGKKQKFFSKNEVDILKTQYKDVFEYKGNTYALFLRRSSSILGTGKFCTFIIPNTLLLNSTCTKVRKFLLYNTSICNLVNIRDKVFEDAEIGGNLIVIYKNGQSQDRHKIKTVGIEALERFTGSLEYNKMLQKTYLSNDGYRFYLDTPSLELMNKICRKSSTLDELSSFYNGIKTGNNKKFIADKKIDKRYRKIIRGRDIERYRIEFGKKYVLFDKELLWSNTNEEKLTKNPKIVMRQTGDRLVGALDTNGYLTMDTTHLIFDTRVNIKFLLAILNSELLNWFHRAMTAEQGRAFAEIKIVNLKRLPIRNSSIEEQNAFEIIVDEILAITKDDDYSENPAKQAKVKELEKQIDQMVYELYGLTKEEIAIVEGEDKQ